MLRRVLIAVAVLAGLVALLAGLGYGWLRSTGRAEREGFATVPALAADVEVRWDRWAVPHLKGQRGVDLAAALGWLHANDRYLQMELGRLRVEGHLAALFGERALPLDREARTLRFREAAERLWESAGSESRRWLTAYAAGVNARLYDRSGRLPPLLAVLRARPEAWTPVDSLGMAVLMGRDLSFWQGRPEELRFEWLGRFGPERTAQLIGGWIGGSTAGRGGEASLHLPAEILGMARAWAAENAGPLGAPGAADGDPTGTVGGSNNWTLGSSLSASGAPLVANDPHLGLRLPPVWYQAHLRSPDYEAAGMTLPGMPAVVIGRGAEVAWALTNVMLDDHDVFFERLDAEGANVARGAGWSPVTRRTERLRVRNGDAVEIELAATDIGPLLPAEPEHGLPPRSLAWTMYQPADPLSAFLHLARAGRVEEVPAGIAGYVSPAQNLVVADRAGGLLYTVLGRLPARGRGDGRLPSPGWDPAYRWRGLAEVAANPRVLSPPDDRLITANNDLRPPGSSFSADFDLAARADRIGRLLSAPAGGPMDAAAAERRAGWSPSALAAVQADVRYAYAGEIVETLAVSATSETAARAAAELRNWDGRMEVRGRSALFALFERELVSAALGDELDLDRVSVKDGYTWARGLLDGELSPDWFDDVRTPEVEDRDEIVDAALRRAWAMGVARWGEETRNWAWGELHTLELRHPLGALPLLGKLANRGPYPMPGSGATVAAFGGRWKAGVLPVTYGPSMRWIADLGDPDASLAVIPGGQAGHPFDPHYDDQIALYLSGRLHEVQWTEEAIRAATVSTLWLER
jgi:penicillin G amidase